MAQTARLQSSAGALSTFSSPLGFLFGAVAISLAAMGGWVVPGGLMRAVSSGVLAALALLVLWPQARSIAARLRWALFDALAVFSYAALCNPSGVLWAAPRGFMDLFAFTPIGAGCAIALYLGSNALIIRLSGHRPHSAASIALALIPYLFCVFASLGSTVPAQLGALLTRGLMLGPDVDAAIGRAIVLFVFNEAIIAGAAIALGRSLPRDWRLHLTLLVAAVFCAVTPMLASAGALAQIEALPAPLIVLAMASAAAAAQAGIWGQTYLVTQAIADLLHGVPPIEPGIAKPWRSGMAKGAVYGFVFMGLIAFCGMLIAVPSLMNAFAVSGAFGAALVGAFAFPLGRTILESTDSTPPFARRLMVEFRRPNNYLRGLAVGAAVFLAFALNVPARASFDRFIFGAIAGAAAYAGVDLASSIVPLMTRSRRHLSSWRVYFLGVVLGAVTGGAIAWYFDAGQLAVVKEKFYAYSATFYPHWSRPIASYGIYPLFSKWGATDLGLVEGGVKLFYIESVSGVIQWIFAAPLFSINLFFLTALVKRDVKPLRALLSEDGIRKLVDNAIMVLRWGLWMAPVIYTFLKVGNDAAWYNQDGAVRTGVSTIMSFVLTPKGFADWSLGVFTALLAYDWLRVLIWFDHMGLRVATLVNLSFVGGDILDERAGKFLGKAQKSRAIPDGLRRFGTWAPLLLPFYIPRGEQWDRAWSGAEQLRLSTPPLANVLLGYAFAGGAAALFLGIVGLRKLASGRPRPGHGTGLAGTPGAMPFVLTNGLLTTEWYDDGQSATQVERSARKGPPIDLSRRPDDPLQPRGKFLYLREGDKPLWSLGHSPVIHDKDETTLQRLSPTQLFLSHTHDGIRAEATIEVVDGQPVEITRLKLVNLERRPRRIIIATLREWVINETGVERRDPAYNAIHVGTWFVRDLGAIIAQNRLLKTHQTRQSLRRVSPEVAFHAAGPGATGDVAIIGYEDVKARFYGLGSAGDPDSLAPGASLRAVEDEGLMYGFDPCASLRAEARLAPESTTEIILVDGWAKDFASAAALIAQHLGQPVASHEALREIETRQRMPVAPPVPAGPRATFGADGRTLETGIGTPRPFAHVLANAFGQGAVLTNDGDIFSFFANARQNSLTPFRMGEGRAGPASQAIYVVDMANGAADCATFVPLRRRDTEYNVTFGIGYAVHKSRRGDLTLEQTTFVPPGRSVEMKILRLINHGASDKLYSVVPMVEMVLAETPLESQGGLQTARDENGRALYYSNPRNDFVRGWAFVSTSLNAEFAETSRRRCLGSPTREPRLPYMVEHGHPDAGSEAGVRYVAAFSGTIEVKAGSESSLALAIGQTGNLDEAKHFAGVAGSVDWAHKTLEETHRFWDETLGVLRIETNRPDFDRLINDWLPYQLLAARLWGRTGPAQRSGATGYRDQLQDVLPLIVLAPDLSRRQILLHAARQFIEGDAVKWWHTAPGGGTGLADRTHSSDPHLWLPHVAMRYVAGTGDEAILDVEVPFIEADAVPDNEEGRASVPLPSRESASLFEHCRRSIEWTLARMGRNGLPLMGTGDWDDGMNLVGFEGRGESVWVGFFLHGILVDFAVLMDKRGQRPQAQRYRDEAAKLRTALDACWRGDRFLRAFADNGKELAPMSAMTASWPVLSGAVTHERGAMAVDEALKILGKPDRILLVSPHYDDESDPFPGRSADYPPGVRENGGQYSHGSSWFVDALVKLAESAAANGDEAASQAFFARAFETWSAISPLSKYSTLEAADVYGLPPHQQPADVYEGPGYSGRGGWAWYTGSAARMLTCAYAMLGLKLDRGEFGLRDDAFAAKGGLLLKSVTFRGRSFDPKGAGSVKEHEIA